LLLYVFQTSTFNFQHGNVFFNLSENLFAIFEAPMESDWVNFYDAKYLRLEYGEGIGVVGRRDHPT